jgi:DNA-binding MarR family transcriptional regulator
MLLFVKGRPAERRKTMQRTRKKTGARDPRTAEPERTASAAEPSLCNSTALRKATRRVSQLYDAALAPCGLRSTQRSILIHIARAGAPTMGELAASLVLDRSALAHNLKPLERDGLVAVSVDPADKRSRLVRLTGRGETKLLESRSLWQQAQQRFEAAYGVEESGALRRALALIASTEFGTEASPAPPAE